MLWRLLISKILLKENPNIIYNLSFPVSRQKDEMDIQNKKFLQFLQDAFHLYDKDKDGSITKSEIKTLFRVQEANS